MAQEPSAESSEIQHSLVPLARRDAILLLEAGYLWLDLGEPDKARDVFIGAAALMPKSEVPQIALGTLEFADAHYDKALRAYRAAQRAAPKAALPRAHVGEALLFMGKPDAGLKELRAAIEMEPEGEAARFAQSLIDAHEIGAFAHLVPAKKK